MTNLSIARTRFDPFSFKSIKSIKYYSPNITFLMRRDEIIISRSFTFVLMSSPDIREQERGGDVRKRAED